MSNSLAVLRLDRVPYGQALALQQRLRTALKSDDAAGRGLPDHCGGYLVCLEHPPTVTLGKRGSFDDLINHQWLADRGVDIFEIDRGGEATYHEPGQLVVYPILRLRALDHGVVDVIRAMARCLGQTCQDYGKAASYDVDHPGLWTTDERPRRKLASVGMRVQSGITTHGAAMNLVNDMLGFSMIVACGMPNAPMARLADYVDGRVDVASFRDAFIDRFAQCLGVDLIDHDLALPGPDDWVEPATGWLVDV